MTRFLEWLGDNPTAWFLLLLAAFMGTALLIGWSCSPVTPDPFTPTTYAPWTPATAAPPVETEVVP